MDPVKPDYGGACTSRVVSALRAGGVESWVPEAVRGADAVVLFVIDGLGWNIVDGHRDLMPVLSGMQGGPISTVVPSTTVTAMTSFTTGLPPAEHGVVGYRMVVDGQVLNLLRWSMPNGRPPNPEDLQPRLAFNGDAVPVVTKAEFANTGFTGLHLRGAELHGWFGTSSIGVHCRELVASGERFVFAYYGQADIVFHMHGLSGEYYETELRFVDRLVGDVLDSLPGNVAVVVCADHGHVQLTGHVQLGDAAKLVAIQAGEGRFRYLHAKAGAAAELRDACAVFEDRAWVLSREQLVDEGWLGPKAPGPSVLKRIGDVVLAAREPIAFVDPANQGELKLLSAHGSFTPDDMLVPLLGGRGRR